MFFWDRFKPSPSKEIHPEVADGPGGTYPIPCLMDDGFMKFSFSHLAFSVTFGISIPLACRKRWQMVLEGPIPVLNG